MTERDGAVEALAALKQDVDDLFDGSRVTSVSRSNFDAFIQRALFIPAPAPPALARAGEAMREWITTKMDYGAHPDLARIVDEWRAALAAPAPPAPESGLIERSYDPERYEPAVDDFGNQYLSPLSAEREPALDVERLADAYHYTAHGGDLRTCLRPDCTLRTAARKMYARLIAQQDAH